MQSPVLHWISLRLRLLLAAMFLVACLLPPYVAPTAMGAEDIGVSSRQFLFVEDGFLMKTSSLGEQGSRLAYSEGLVHTVKNGESLDKIAEQYGISAETIRWANGLQDNVGLQPGQDLVILPVDGVLHTVRRGQTLAKIAELYEIPQEAIVRQNHIRGGYIVAGQQLIVPNAKPIGAISPEVAANEALRFADRLPQRDIRLRLNLPNAKPVPVTPGSAPVISAVITSTTLQWPCENCQITQNFGPSHYALDIQTRGSGPIFAAENGTVIRSATGWNGGYGSVIEIDHGNGLVTLYGHNRDLYVAVGDTVVRGQKIAWMGNTGLVHGPTGIHIHFEVRVNGVKKNPLLYLE